MVVVLGLLWCFLALGDGEVPLLPEPVPTVKCVEALNVARVQAVDSEILEKLRTLRAALKPPRKFFEIVRWVREAKPPADQIVRAAFLFKSLSDPNLYEQEYERKYVADQTFDLATSVYLSGLAVLVANWYFFDGTLAPPLSAQTSIKSAIVLLVSPIVAGILSQFFPKPAYFANRVLVGIAQDRAQAKLEERIAISLYAQFEERDRDLSLEEFKTRFLEIARLSQTAFEKLELWETLPSNSPDDGETEENRQTSTQ